MSGGEKEIVVHPGEWALPGTLTVPDGDTGGQFPLVIFVPGSGPNDRDETVGRQKLFKDLALYLAKLGVASLRYDKRTYVYGKKMAGDPSLTVYEETVEDALHAVRLAKDEETVNSGRIFIAGHSMGGYLIPRIDAADTGNMVAGYISLAGAARPMQEMVLEQIDYLLSLNPGASETDKAASRKQYADAVAAVNRLTEADRGSTAPILGAFPTYWLDLADYRPAREILKVRKPLLFLQGKNDYQVTQADFGLWKAALNERSNVRFVLYDGLSHMFTKTEKKGTPDDYAVYARADERVAADIRAFIAGI